MGIRVAILLFDRVTALDAVGPYEVLSRVPGAEVEFVGLRRGEVRTDVGTLGLVVDRSIEEATEPDVVVVPGGIGQRDHMTDGPVHEWLRAVDEHTTWTTSVCTGSLVLASAGLLRGRRATSHWVRVEDLAAYGVDPVSERVVVDGKYVTAGGVSSGIDMALDLVGRMEGELVARAVQCGIEYDPAPPYDAGSPAKAGPEIAGFLRSLKEELF